MDRVAEEEIMYDKAVVDAYVSADFSETNELFVDRLLELYPVDDMMVADLGTGAADIPIRLSLARPDWSIVAVDASATMLAVARRNIDRLGMSSLRVTLHRSYVQKTDLEEGYNLVLSNSILHHVRNTEPFWDEVKRLLMPGARDGAIPRGRVFMRDLCRPNTEDDARRIVEECAGSESEVLKREFYNSLLAAYTMNEVYEQLKFAGLDSKLSIERSSNRHLDIYGEI